MKKLLAGLALAAGIAVGMGAGASAAYPPGGPGTVSSTHSCESSAGELTGWSFTVSYDVTEPDTTLTISQGMNLVPAIVRSVPVGSGSITIDSDSSGAAPEHGYFFRTATLTSGGKSVSTGIGACPIPSVGPNADPTTTNPTPDTGPPPDPVGDISFGPVECSREEDGTVFSWQVDVTVDVMMEGALVAVYGPNGNVYRSPEDVPIGSTSFTIGTGEPGFDEVPGDETLTVTLIADDLGTSEDLTPCPTGEEGGSTTTSTNPSRVGTVWLEQSECVVDPDDPNKIKDWYLIVNYDLVAEEAQLTIDDQRGTLYVDQMVTGSGSLRFDQSIAPFDKAEAPFQEFRVTLLAYDEVAQADSTPCGLPGTDSTNVTTSSTTATSISATLPATGTRVGSLVILALGFVGVGTVLLRSARQRRLPS